MAETVDGNNSAQDADETLVAEEVEDEDEATTEQIPSPSHENTVGHMEIALMEALNAWQKRLDTSTPPLTPTCKTAAPQNAGGCDPAGH